MSAKSRMPSYAGEQMPETDTFLSLGSNVGDRADNLEAALRILSRKINIVTVSSVYETEPVGFAEQPPFLNLACRASTDLPAAKLLSLAQLTETQIGRRFTFRNGPRVIDIDILLYGDTIVRTKELQIPHPAIHERAFVLVPMVEIAPDVIHPTLHKTMRQLLSETPDRHWVHALQGGEDVPALY